MIDYLVDNTTSDLLIGDGDFVKGDSTLQNQKALLMGAANDYKQFPDACVGIMNFLNDTGDTSDLMRQIRIKYAGDGMNVQSLAMVNGKINVNAPYAG
ncbi:hypothetical protein [uncultured Mucilaginibacter sp.]|uniref:hypothetical protein n=1 Tax=uncultured Mucilaginibacter sp. TaxID=797541 RepID=UPI0025D86E5F|nr:hypothetical protein [uncultured Mucilaginibacter sp.]